jgi:ribosomal-protein-alanine N-acetyltransferase
MENMPYQPELQRVTRSAESWTVTTSDWRAGLPTLSAAHVTLRELRLSDAPSLLAMLATEEVMRFISPPPSTVEGFERFIEWARREREDGTYACFAVVPAGGDDAIGLVQIRELEPTFSTAEWGFAIGSPFWGTGMFAEAARLAVDFAFGTIGVHRLEARAAVQNGRGNGLLRKIGAVQEGVLRKSLLRNGRYCDQVLWGIVEDDWREAREQRGRWTPQVH